MSGEPVPATPVGPVIRIVDDDQALRRALVRLLRAASFAVRDYASAAEFLLRDTDGAPGCVVLDIRMPGQNGLEVQETLARHDNPLPVVFLTGHGDVPTTVRAMKAGAVDFLLKPVDRHSLLGAIRGALARDAENRALQERLRALRDRYESLTPRERDVFSHVVAGKLNKQIAADLGTSERTVKAHRAQVMSKMQVGSVAEMVRAADALRDAG